MRLRAGSTDVPHEDSGLVGTPYFWTGVGTTVAVWALVMLVLWF